MNRSANLCKRLGICVIIYMISVFNLTANNRFGKEYIPEIHQQGRTLTGTVVDENGEPVIGANVSVKGTTIGTITDYNGQFSLGNVSAHATLLISYNGLYPETDSFAGYPNQRSISFGTNISF